jgi:hypothetical protein
VVTLALALKGRNAGCAVNALPIAGAAAFDMGGAWLSALAQWVEEYVEYAGLACELQFERIAFSYAQARRPKQALKSARIGSDNAR